MIEIYYKQIDFLKGIAIVCVLLLHTLGLKNHSVFLFFLVLCVPLFLVLIGLTGAISLSNGFDPVPYAWKKYVRFIFPIILISFLSVGIAMISQSNTGGPFVFIMTLTYFFLLPQTYLGVIPYIVAGGNYFVTLVFGSIIIIPAVYFAFKRNLILTVVGSCVISGLVQIWFYFNGYSGFGTNQGILVPLLQIFYPLFAIALGMTLFDSLQQKTLPPWFAFAGAGSVLSMIAILLFHFYSFFALYILYFPAVAYTVWIAIDRDWNFAPLEFVGKASWHIYLIQMVYLTFRSEQIHWGVDIALCLTFGIGFYLAYDRLIVKRLSIGVIKND